MIDYLYSPQCEYGCGNIAQFQIWNGKWCCENNYNHCPENKNKTRLRQLGKNNSFFGKTHSDELKIKWSQDRQGDKHPLYGKHHSKETKEIIGLKNKGKTPSKETRQKMKDNSFCRGKKAWNNKENGYIEPEETRIKKSLAKKGKKQSKELIEKRVAKIKGRKQSEETRLQISESNKGKCPWNKGKTGLQIAWNLGLFHSDETKQKISIANKGRSSPFKKEKVIKTIEEKRKNRSEGAIKSWTKERRIQASLTIKRKFLEDKEFIERLKKSQSNKPNNKEKQLLTILSQNNFVYTGDWSIEIGGRNPDFINKDKNLIVELFGDYWHGEKFRQEKLNDFSSNEEHERERIEYFEKYGYKCLVIWEHELKNIEKVNQKIEEVFNEDSVLC